VVAVDEGELREQWRRDAAVRERGHPDGDGVLVELGVELVALARDAADDLPA
jgi:hypothetical protein